MTQFTTFPLVLGGDSSIRAHASLALPMVFEFAYFTLGFDILDKKFFVVVCLEEISLQGMRMTIATCVGSIHRIAGFCLSQR